MKKILLISFAFLGFCAAAIAQCVTPVASNVCPGNLQKLTANVTGSAPTTFTNAATINMPNGQPATSTGNFGPYPSAITASGMPTTGMTVASVTLTGMNHTFTGDLDIILVSPGGQSIILLADAGGLQDLSNTTITFQDNGAALSTADPIPSGTYVPTTAAGATWNFPAPGPGTAAATNTTLGSLTGNMNGTWSLYGVDDAGGDYGSITGGWSISFIQYPLVTWTGPAGTIFTDAAGTAPYAAGTSTLAVWVKPTVNSSYTATVSAGACAGTNTVTVGINAPNACYCTSAATNATDEDIFNVTLGTLNNSSTCTSVVTGTGSVINKYSNYTNGTTATAIPSLVQGATYPLSVQVGTCGGNFGNSVAVFIDFNQNGNFTDPGEKVYGGAATITGPHTETANIVIPANAPLNLTRMRVMVVEGTAGTAILPCQTYGWGETEDYNVAIVPCLPNTVMTQPAAVSAACGASTSGFTALLAGSPGTFLWQAQTTAGGVWTNLSNTAPYSNVTTNILTINPVATTMNGYNYRLLYSNGCTGTSFTGAAALTVTPIAATFTQTPAALCATGTTSQTIAVTGGGTGVFTPNTGLYTDAAHTIAYTGTAVTTVYAFPAATAAYSLVVTNGACVSTPATVTVTVNTPVAGTPVLPAATAICANGTGTISFTGITAGTGLTYQWQVNTIAAPATFTNVTNGGVYSGATTAALTITNPTAAMSGLKYNVIVSSVSCASTVTSNNTTLTVNPVPVVVLTAAPTTQASPTSPVTLTAAVSSATAPLTYQWYLNNVAVAGATGATFTPDVNAVGDYSVRVTDANGCGSITSTPISITVTRGSTIVPFIYPSPNSGTFQVRYYNATATATQNQAAMVNVYDQKGSRVYTQRYVVNGPYTQMNVNLGTHSRGIYRVEISDANGNRLNTGTVMVF